jgi:glycosyltransferase involved in cell wall biosynthesis/SAM-dependent methyltransferase
MAKIPCSVSVITLNVERELPRCLENLKDFAEIIVCDGNSTDRTREIAEAAGARVVRQYETDEPETRCVMDKAAVRQKAMDASTLPWRFFMDADDTLSAEAIREIRAIVEHPEPSHLIYRMPTRVCIDDGRCFDHQAASPGYQTRLVHEKVGARFKGPVHERLVFDEQAFPVGTLKNPYEFRWPEARFTHHWRFLRSYVEKEVAVMSFPTFGAYLRWGLVWRLRALIGYAVRVVVTYARFGSNGTMPLSVETAIVRYHASLLLRAAAKAFARSFAGSFLLETVRGKDSYRFLSNRSLVGLEIYGRVLDIGGGDGTSSHYRYFSMRRWHRFIRVDINPDAKPDIVADISATRLPLEDGYADTALLMNVLEHVPDAAATLKETHRLLTSGGVVYAVIPFFVNVHPDPKDFRRLTGQGLRRIFEEAGFSCEKIEAFGSGPFLAAHYQLEPFLPRIVRLATVPLALGLDALAHTIRPKLFSKEKSPLGYLVVARKS